MQADLDKTYKVSYPDDSNPLRHRDENLGKMNYIEATNVARRWIKDHANVFIWDGSSQIFGVDPTGVRLINSTIDHPHYQEHLKIKIELDRAWSENRIRYFQ